MLCGFDIKFVIYASLRKIEIPSHFKSVWPLI